jgi:hypothetical protein
MKLFDVGVSSRGNGGAEKKEDEKKKKENKEGERNGNTCRMFGIVIKGRTRGSVGLSPECERKGMENSWQ